MKRFFLLFFILLLVSLAAAGTFAYTSLKAISSDKREISFQVKKGDSLTHVSKNLFTLGLIKNDYVFKGYGIYKKYDHMLKEGEYSISPSQSVEEIYQILIVGRQKLISVTIPEGYTATKIAVILEENGVVSRDDFIKAIGNKGLLNLYSIPFDSAEGYLFPDTYSFQEEYPPLLVVESFLKNFFSNVKKIYPSYAKLTPKQLGDKVILASIVEREYKNRSEVRKISSVFYNRLERRMKLQSCATVMYVLTEELGGEHRNRLFFEDLEVESKYNTYLHSGLPPGAIANPGYYSLDAVFNPENTDYIYFVVKDRVKGTHNFSSKYSAHEEARAQYISGFESKR